MPVARRAEPDDDTLRTCRDGYRSRLATEERQRVWKSFRGSTCGERWFASLLDAFGPLCAYCNHCPASTIDHVSPQANGHDPLDWANWLPACGDCNRRKSTLDLLEPLGGDPRSELRFDLVLGEPALVVLADGRPDARAERAVTKLKLDAQVFNLARLDRLVLAASLLKELVDGNDVNGVQRFAEGQLSRFTAHRAILRELFLEDDPILNPFHALAQRAKQAYPALHEWARAPRAAPWVA